jgi:hypothetical protein
MCSVLTGLLRAVYGLCKGSVLRNNSECLKWGDFGATLDFSWRANSRYLSFSGEARRMQQWDNGVLAGKQGALEGAA